MTRILLALLMTMSASIAFAKKFEGRDDNGHSCFVVLDKTAKGVVIGTGDEQGSKLYYAQKKVNNTYFKYKSGHRNMVLMKVAMYPNAGRIDAWSWPRGRLKICTASLK